MLNEQKNKELELAWEYVQKTKVNIFLTGRAGTGKTTFLKRLIKESPKNHIVVAPTGVAALNASGVTIHSFFQLPFGVTLPEYVRKEGDSGVERFRFNRAKISIIRSLELIIIDEISMVRADMLDAIDAVLKRIRHSTKPFGGVQMLMIGDVQQLAPVAKEDEWNILKEHYNSTFFFESKALKESGYVYIELKRIYRQTEGEFINLLEKVRTNSLNSNDLSQINKRYLENFSPNKEEGYITLCTHNNSAQQINEVKMQEINAPTYTFTAEVSGDFPEYMFPTNKFLSLKKGAQVMFTKNDISPDKKFVNGTIGIITNISKESIEVEPLDNQGETIFVEQQEWENQTYDINPETKEITSKIIGMFKQYPLKLAWAITIHKSQGLTFDKAIIDAPDRLLTGKFT
jgi:ATP-dependent exoDNAse (exonuclease V), alpha subunit - helicase superfamily I member